MERSGINGMARITQTMDYRYSLDGKNSNNPKLVYDIEINADFSEFDKAIDNAIVKAQRLSEMVEKADNRVNSLAKKQEGAMNNLNTIEVTFKNGRSAVWEADKGEWDDYAYDGTAFIIKKGGAWVGIYNMDSVISVVVK